MLEVSALPVGFPSKQNPLVTSTQRLMGAAGPNNDPKPYPFIPPTNSVLDVGDPTVIKTKSQP